MVTTLRHMWHEYFQLTFYPQYVCIGRLLYQSIIELNGHTNCISE